MSKSSSDSVATTIHEFLNSQSVAIVGASNNPSRWGYHVTNAIIQGGFEGNIIPIHPKASEILGLRAYASILDYPKKIDLVIFCVSNNIIPYVIPDCISKNIKAGVICASGYREVGNYEKEQDILNLIQDSEFRIVGPNVQGICYLPNHLCAQMGQIIKKPGPIAIISQSGSITSIIAKWAENDGIGVSGMINLGNQLDLCESDFIEFFAEDPNTTAIGLYLEGPKDGTRFLDTLKSCSRKKPIVVFKSGRTPKGQKVATTHTASIFGNDDVFSSAMKQTGVMRKKRLDDFYDSLKTLSLQPLPNGKRIFIFTTSGGVATIASDILNEEELKIVTLTDQMKKYINEEDILKSAIVGNPFDIPSPDPVDFRKCFNAVAGCDALFDIADMFLIIFADPISEIALEINAFREKIKKPIVVVIQNGNENEREESIAIQRYGIPVFNLVERGAKSASALYEYLELLHEGRTSHF